MNVTCSAEAADAVAARHATSPMPQRRLRISLLRWMGSAVNAGPVVGAEAFSAVRPERSRPRGRSVGWPATGEDHHAGRKNLGAEGLAALRFDAARAQDAQRLLRVERNVAMMLVDAPPAFVIANEGGDVAVEAFGRGAREARDDGPVVFDAGVNLPGVAAFGERLRDEVERERAARPQRLRDLDERL